MQKLIKPLGLLVLLILLCAVISKLLSGNQTLADYAKANPELAYAVKATPTPISTPSPTASPSPSATPTATPTPIPASSLLFPESPEATHYQDCFFFQPLTDDVIATIVGVSYPITKSDAENAAVPTFNVIDDTATAAISFDDLRYVGVLYYDFDGKQQNGSLICNKAIAEDLVEIFYELYLNEYKIAKIRLIEEYNGDDTASMLDNNTSCFNYRVVDDTDTLSKHAIGCAVDVNPFYNPYVVFDKDGSGETYISPEGSEPYADRSKDFAYKIDENDLCYKLFKEHGFIWGGDWNSCKDYQHFQKAVQ